MEPIKFVYIPACDACGRSAELGADECICEPCKARHRLAQFRARMFNADLQASLALRDARATENAAARERCTANQDLCTLLLADARRRGRSTIDWSEYFRNLGIGAP